MMIKNIFSIAMLFCAMAMLMGCAQTIPKEALELSQESFELRQLQTRSFDTSNEKKLLSAGAGVLQDLGFNIDESEMGLGVIVGSKDRDATEAGQVAGAVFMAVMFGANMAIDKNQKIMASLITHPSGKQTKLRITLQRIVWNTQGQVSKTQSITEPEIYQEFFDNLSKAVFLEANGI
ncbi:MAG: hypothetical protein CO093_07905 [Alphaproteobacteria bacterium CG_4_9_14_3_um_filter_47_13]|nr:MAG: hypothetical protein CO093_07905 [Alphaproteobacteria bacterium CG_4_9_14_3_um_filter_47_13]